MFTVLIRVSDDLLMALVPVVAEDRGLTFSAHELDIVYHFFGFGEV